MCLGRRRRQGAPAASVCSSSARQLVALSFKPFTPSDAVSGAPTQVAELRTALLALLEARRASQLHAAALQELKGSYEASVESTDFKQRLDQRAQQLAAQQP